MKRRIMQLAAAACVLALMCVLPALASADRFAVVKGGRLNLRAYPSVNAQSLGKYDTGTWVVAGSESDGWCSVTTLSGKRGYMSAQYLNFGLYNGGATVRYANGGYVNLRSGPSYDDGVIARVTSGSTVHIQGQYGEWYYVHVDVGGYTRYGYMNQAFIDTGVTTSIVTTRNGGKVNVRSGPGSSYGSVGSLASGTKVNVLLKGNGWYMISANGLEGFMSTQYLSGSGTTTSQTAWVNNPKSTQVLNLREFPDQSARSIGQYRNGTQVKVVKRGSSWCEVYVGTKHGYMMTRYLSFDGSYVRPSYTSVPSYPSYPSYPVYPSYPTATPTPQVQYITPRPQVEYITPKPHRTSGPAEPQSGDTITLAIAAGGSSNRINVYNDAAMTSYKASYPHGTSAMMLKYGTSSCMIYIDGGVAHVSTWNVNY